MRVFSSSSKLHPSHAPIAIAATHLPFITSNSEGTRIRFGEGRSVTVVKPLDEVMDRLNKMNRLRGGRGASLFRGMSINVEGLCIPRFSIVMILGEAHDDLRDIRRLLVARTALDGLIRCYP